MNGATLGRARPLARRSSRGFTMIEVMGAVLLTSIVIFIAVAFQINLGSATENARERLRSQRQAVALLDRMARDLAGAYFIAPRIVEGVTADTPWIFLTVQDFLAEGIETDSSNAIKFNTRNYTPQALDGHSSDLALVAYYVERQEDRPGYQLMRWRSIHMPQGNDPTFPEPDDSDADVMGEDIASFEIRLIDQSGEELPSWSSIRRQGPIALPLGVKLELSMLTSDEISEGEVDQDLERSDTGDDIDDDDELGDGEGDGAERRKKFSKTVLLPLRPLDWTFLEEIASTTDVGYDEDGYADEDEDEDEDDSDQREEDDLDEDHDSDGPFDDDEEGDFGNLNSNSFGTRHLAKTTSAGSEHSWSVS